MHCLPWSRASHRGQSGSPHSFFCARSSSSPSMGAWHDSAPQQAARCKPLPFRRTAAHAASHTLRDYSEEGLRAHLAAEVAADAGHSVVDRPARLAPAPVGGEVCPPPLLTLLTSAADIFEQLPPACMQAHTTRYRRAACKTGRTQDTRLGDV